MVIDSRTREYLINNKIKTILFDSTLFLIEKVLKSTIKKRIPLQGFMFEIDISEKCDK